MTEIEKDVGGWLYNKVNLYPLDECQFLVCGSIRLPEELIFLVTDMGQCNGKRVPRLSTEILGFRYQGDAGQGFHVTCFDYQKTAYDFRGSVFQLVKLGLLC